MIIINTLKKKSLPLLSCRDVPSTEAKAGLSTKLYTNVLTCFNVVNLGVLSSIALRNTVAAHVNYISRSSSLTVGKTQQLVATHILFFFFSYSQE